MSDEDNSLLDIGANTGIFLSLMEEKGMSAIGLEPNRAAASFGRDNFGVEILPVSLEEFEGNWKTKFDVVTLFNVLEHFTGPESSMQKIRRLLKVNGILLLEVPHIFTLHSLLSGGYWQHFEQSHN